MSGPSNLLYFGVRLELFLSVKCWLCDAVSRTEEPKLTGIHLDDRTMTLSGEQDELSAIGFVVCFR